MSGVTDPHDCLRIPEKWVSADVADAAEVADIAAALRSGRLRAWLPAVGQDTQSGFGAEFWSRLAGPRGHAVIEIPYGLSPLVAAALLATWMGLRSEQVHDDIGGTVSHVVSGVGHRHDQSWHTDSTPWCEPNRYSVLGLLSHGGAADQSTDLLSLDSLSGGLASDPAAWSALRSDPIPWRRNFPQLAELHAPVMAALHPRWVWPVLEELMDEFSPDLRRGVALVARLLNEVPHYSPVVTRSQLLVFDNGRMLHRGPRLEESSGRELIRIKVTGRAIA